MNGKTVNVDDARKRIIQHWQEKWNTGTSSIWKAKLLPDIWKFGKVNSYLTQLLSEHGYLCTYVYKIGNMTQLNCIYGYASMVIACIDDAKYTFFHCERWVLERRNLEAKIGACTINNFCDLILSSEENWNSMASYSEVLLKSKKFDLEKRSRMDV